MSGDAMTDHDLLREVHHDVRYIRETIADHEERIRRLEAEQRPTEGTHRGGRLMSLLQFVASMWGRT